MSVTEHYAKNFSQHCRFATSVENAEKGIAIEIESEPMNNSIIEQIEALDDYYAAYWLDGRELKALAGSHQRLLKANIAVRDATYAGAEYDAGCELRAAIEEAEKL